MFYLQAFHSRQQLAHQSSVGLPGAVGKESLAGAVDFADAGGEYQLAGVVGRDAATGQDLEVVEGLGLFHQLAYQPGSFHGGGLLTAGEQTGASAVGEGRETPERPQRGPIEGPMKSDLHVLGLPDGATCQFDIDTALGIEEAHDHGGGPQAAAAVDGGHNLIHFGLRVAEVARTRAHEHVGAQTEGADAVLDIVVGRCEAAALQVAAELNTLGSTLLGGYG